MTLRRDPHSVRDMTTTTTGHEPRSAFARMLRRRSRELGLSQAKLAARIGISPGGLGAWLSGCQPKMKPATLRALAKALELEPRVVWKAAGFLPPGCRCAAPTVVEPDEAAPESEVQP